MMSTFKSKISTILAILAVSTFLMTSCKSKKLATQPEVVAPPPAPVEKAPEPAKPVVKDTDNDGVPDDQDKCPDVKGTAANNGCPEETPKPMKFKNIQFEFNSSVLKTESYDVLEKVAAQMRKYPTWKYELDGNASAEGTEKRNMMLSIDRANSVKAYLVNSGIDASRLTVKGFGESKPIADNSTEAGRILNRRVEITPLN